MTEYLLNCAARQNLICGFEHIIRAALPDIYQKRYTAVKLCFQGSLQYNASGIHSGQSVFTGANEESADHITQTQP